MDFLTNGIKQLKHLSENDKIGFFPYIISGINSKCTKDLNVRDGTMQDTGKAFLTVIGCLATIKKKTHYLATFKKSFQ